MRPDQVDEVILGCILQAGLGMNPARQAAIKSGLPDSVPATTVNKVCGSGLQSVMMAAQAIKAGDAEIVVAGGTENMTRAPYLLPGARWGERLGNGAVVDHMIHEGLTDAFHDIHMGVTAENLVERYGISRADQDGFAAESQRRAESAIKSGAFKDEIVPVDVPGKKGETRVDTDDPGRQAESREAQARVQDGFVTAGSFDESATAPPLVWPAERAQRLGLAPIARIVSYASAAVDPKVMGIGPVPAVRMALEKASLGPDAIDLFELNEAFAAQSLAVLRELKLDAQKVNFFGGAIALGHPIGASGARILVTLVHALRARGRRYGVAALCIGGGQGVAMVVERV